MKFKPALSTKVSAVLDYLVQEVMHSAEASSMF